MTTSREKRSTNAVRDVVGGYVRLHGLQRGLAHAAGVLGVSESWARKIHYGEAHAVSAEVADRAEAARGSVLRARLDAARREVQAIEDALASAEASLNSIATRLGGARADILEVPDALRVSVGGRGR